MSDEAGAGAPIDFDRLAAEIDDEVRRRRLSGELPAGFERELDDLFVGLSPKPEPPADIRGALARAEEHWFVRSEVPTASRLPGGHEAKRLVARTVGWCLDFVTGQVNQFNSAVIKLGMALIERIESLEDRVGEEAARLATGEARAAAERGRRPSGGGVVRAWAPLAEATFGGTTGRVLHTECGQGALVERLLGAGVNAYGVDPVEANVAAGAGRGADLRCDPAAAHLALVPEGSLGGMILSGWVDQLSLPERLALLDRATACLAPGGRAMVVATVPGTALSGPDAVAADLAPGRPLHPDTWVHLLAQQGYVGIETHRAHAASYAVTASRPG
ncbi:MAG: hypothetical protein ACRD0F_01645 [Acidimicrobiales bacterium]